MERSSVASSDNARLKATSSENYYLSYLVLIQNVSAPTTYHKTVLLIIPPHYFCSPQSCDWNERENVIAVLCCSPDYNLISAVQILVCLSGS